MRPNNLFSNIMGKNPIANPRNNVGLAIGQLKLTPHGLGKIVNIYRTGRGITTLDGYQKSNPWVVVVLVPNVVIIEYDMSAFLYETSLSSTGEISASFLNA